MADQRDPSLINAPRSLGFPLNQTGAKAIGIVRLVLIAADFPDFTGTSAEIDSLSAQVSQFNEWLSFQSNGRLTASWQFPKKFIRLNRSAREYGVVGFSPETHRAIVNDVITNADADVTYSSIDEVFVYLPNSLTESEPGTNPFDGILSQFGGSDIQTSEGLIGRLKGSGTVSKQTQYGIKPTLWALWAHDLLHTIGVEGHNPVEAFTLESEDYLNFVVSAWNQWLLGWMQESQVACLSAPTSAAHEVDLVPLQSAMSGYRTAIIPLSPTRAIVVESHRNSGLGVNLGASGVLVYLMDTKNVPKYEDREKTSLIGSRFLDPSTVINKSRSPIGRGRVTSLMLVGEFAQFESIRIDFLLTADKDKIRVSTVG